MISRVFTFYKFKKKKKKNQKYLKTNTIFLGTNNARDVLSGRGVILNITKYHQGGSRGPKIMKISSP